MTTTIAEQVRYLAETMTVQASAEASRQVSTR